MNTPPPPPLHHFHSPPSSPYTIHTPDSEGSFDRFVGVAGSDRYSDASSLRSQTMRPKIETRRPSFRGEVVSERPVVEHVMASSTTAGRDFLYFVYTKVGARWDEDPIIDEIPAPQNQIKKKAESRNKKISVIQHLQKMGPNRRAQIERHMQVLNNSETDGSIWEPVYIDNTKIKQRVNVMEVKSFEIIFARKHLRLRRNSMGPIPIRPQSMEHGASREEPKEEKARKDKRKSKDRKAEKPPTMRGAVVDDPFGETRWFDRAGAAAGGQNGGNAGLPGLPPFIPPEQPIGALKPRIISGLDPDKDDIYQALSMPGAFGPELAGLGIPVGAEGGHRRTPVTDDDIIAVEDAPDDMRHFDRQGRSKRRFSNLVNHGLGRRGGQRQRSTSRPRNVRFSDHFGSEVLLPSSGSSEASDDIALMFEEVDELSSRTSEETSGSPAGTKIYRPIPPANRQHRPGPSHTPSSRRYELASNEAVITPARTRHRSSRGAERMEPLTQHPYGLEQPLVRSSTLPIQTAPHYRKPLIRTTSEQPQVNHAYNVRQPLVQGNTSMKRRATIHQDDVPRAMSSDIPPMAVYPDFYESQERHEELDNEEAAQDYMRETIRRRTLQEHEEELTQRERAVLNREREALREQENRQRETLALRSQLENLRLRSELGERRSVYNYEPRDFYKSNR